MILMGVIVGLFTLLPYLVRQIQKERTRQILSDQLRQSIVNMAHALRVGVGFLQALDYTAKEGALPLALEWKRVLQGVHLGQSLASAMAELPVRVPIKEMKWFVTVVRVTQSTGGSLADVLEGLATTLQEQKALRDKVSALTAQGKASGILLSLLPFLMMGALYIVDPKVAMPLFLTRTGQNAIAGVMVSVALGGLLIRKIVSIKVE